jgi:hypothetical protein
MDAPFDVDDIVETIKGAKFWGKVKSLYRVDTEYQIVGIRTPALLEGKSEWRVDVFAIHPEFYGTIHVYPASQLALKSGAPDA